MTSTPTLPLPGLVSYRTKDGREITHPKRGKHYVEARGYARPPGTGPKGETCGSCQHRVAVRCSKTYYKCALTRALWTGGRRTDILVRAAACEKWEKDE